MKKRHDEIIFLAQALCGAEFALAEIKNLMLSGSHTEGRAKRARIVIEILHTVFNEQNYKIQMRGFNKDLCEYQLYPDKDIFELGETYFNMENPGSILFIYDNNIKSEETFEITHEFPKIIADRFDPQSYDILVSEMRTALSFVE